MKRIISCLTSVFILISLCCAVNAEDEEISSEAEYSLVTPASEAYPDDGKKLTDGIYGTHPEGLDGFFASGAYVGFNKDNVNENGKFAVIVDLGKKHGNISGVTVGYLNEIAAGISAPMSISIALSDDRNGAYTEIGVLDTAPQDIDTAATYAKTLETNNASGRYVLVTITPMGYTDKEGITSIAPWTFIDEISVRAVSEPKEDHSQLEESAESSDDLSRTESEPTDDEVAPDNSQSDESKKPENSDVSDNSDNSDNSGVLDTSDMSDESKSPETSDVSDNSDVSDTEPDKTPQTGDDLEIFAFVLLALASLGMMIALFTTKKNREF